MTPQCDLTSDHLLLRDNAGNGITKIYSLHSGSVHARIGQGLVNRLDRKAADAATDMFAKGRHSDTRDHHPVHLVRRAAGAPPPTRVD